MSRGLLCGTSRQADIIQPLRFHFNLVLSLTPSQEFILICFRYFEKIKSLERAIKDLFKQVLRNILQLVRKTSDSCFEKFESHVLMRRH